MQIYTNNCNGNQIFGLLNTAIILQQKEALIAMVRINIWCNWHQNIHIKCDLSRNQAPSQKKVQTVREYQFT